MNVSEGINLKCGYCGWLIAGSCGNIFRHKCFKKFSEEMHALHVDENHVARMIARNYYKENDPQNTSVIPVEDNSKSISDDSDEILIELVFQRPAIWNYKLPLRDRTKLKIEALWVEISNVMGGGKATPTWAKTRWRDLRDSYVKARKKARAYIPSGSDAESATKLRSTSFRFFKQMQFLEVAYTTETTISSLDPIPLQISQNSNADLDGCFSGAATNVDALTVPLGPSPIKVPSGPSSAPLLLISETAVTRASPALTKKRKYQDTDPSGVATDADALTLLQRPSPIIVEPNELLSAPLLLTSETAVTPKTSPALTKNKKKHQDTAMQEVLLEALRESSKAPDAVDGMLLMLGEGLRRLSFRKRFLLQIKWLGELMEAQERSLTTNE
ncbi:uncharacterized protein [Linepithema humile]|uniref:uncharacterized protein n=1 Tax=Linepithema humile TaxID=83485 RepID=UPI00351DF4BC